MFQSTTVLSFDKETENKVRYQALVEDTEFNLYIPKWRVRNPWPEEIEVVISPVSTDHFRATAPTSLNSAALTEPSVAAVVCMTDPHTKTVRYDPEGDTADWEIGATYVPSCLLRDPPPQQLHIEVRWR